LLSKESQNLAPAEGYPNKKRHQIRIVHGRHAVLKSLIFSAVLHTCVIGSLMAGKGGPLWETRVRIESIVRGLPRIFGKSDFIGHIRESEEMQKDLGMFFLKSEYYAGGIDDNELKESEKKLKEIIERFQQMAEKDKNIHRVLHEIIQEQAGYKRRSSYVSRLVLSRKGNCEARAKLMISIISKVYPNLPVKLQFYRDHVRGMVQIDGKWYALEKPTLAHIDEEDLTGTLLAEPSIYMKSYVDEKTSTEQVKVTDNPNPQKDLHTDSPFHPIPPELNKKLVDYSDVMPPEEEAEVRYEFKDVSEIHKDSEEDEPPAYEADKPIKLTFLTKEEMNEILNGDFFTEFYGKLDERERKMVDLYRNKRYTTLIRRFDISSLKGVIDEEAKKFREYEEWGYAEEDRKMLGGLEDLRKRIFATKDIGQRKIILCQYTQSRKSDDAKTEEDEKKSEERANRIYELKQRGMRDISSMDDTVDFVTFVLSMASISGFSNPDLDTFEEECLRVFQK
jgi:hypothetical protein